MRMRKKSWAAPELEMCDYYVEPFEALSYKGQWSEKFKNKNPLCLEVGCGKGVFTAEFIKKYPDLNMIAIDIKSDVLAVARRNIESTFKDYERKPDNILLVAYNVDRIDSILSPEDKINSIYINFCNPWPKKKHKKRRLTYPKFLEMYKTFLIKGGKIYFKTDDNDLFNDSLEYFESCGLKILYKTYDLHNSDVEDNILTEHEKMFLEKNIKIKYCIAQYS